MDYWRDVSKGAESVFLRGPEGTANQEEGPILCDFQHFQEALLVASEPNHEGGGKNREYTGSV